MLSANLGRGWFSRNIILSSCSRHSACPMPPRGLVYTNITKLTTGNESNLPLFGLLLLEVLFLGAHHFLGTEDIDLLHLDLLGIVSLVVCLVSIDLVEQALLDQIHVVLLLQLLEQNGFLGLLWPERLLDLVNRW